MLIFGHESGHDVASVSIMASSDAPTGRRRGGIRRHGNGWQARVSAGTDPSSGERIILHETVPIAEAHTKAARERAERDAYKQAEKALTRLQAEADTLKVARTKATVGALLDRWMAQHEIDATTRMTYEAQIRLYIRPRIGDVPLVLFVREAAERLEPFYAHLRKCRALCNGRPFVEKHAVDGLHDCAADGCARLRGVLGRGAIGMDQLQPDAVRAAADEASPAAPAPTSQQMTRIVETGSVR